MREEKTESIVTSYENPVYIKFLQVLVNEEKNLFS